MLSSALVLEYSPTRRINTPRRIPLIRFSAHILYLIAFIFPCPSLFAQAEFSAEIVDTQKPDTPTQAKVYFAKDKMRIESQEHNSRGQGVFIMNFASQTSDVLMTQQHMYMEMPAQAMNQRGLYSFFRTGDVENACSDWLKMERNKGGTCHKVGNETVSGRSAVKYEGMNSSGEASSVWQDPKLRFPVKMAGQVERRRVAQHSRGHAVGQPVRDPRRLHQDGHRQHDAAALPAALNEQVALTLAKRRHYTSG
jgi:hypothetical protein